MIDYFNVKSDIRKQYDVCLIGIRSIADSNYIDTSMKVALLLYISDLFEDLKRECDNMRSDIMNSRSNEMVDRIEQMKQIKQVKRLNN